MAVALALSSQPSCTTDGFYMVLFIAYAFICCSFSLLRCLIIINSYVLYHLCYAMSGQL